mgnify:CR=1 FL=1
MRTKINLDDKLTANLYITLTIPFSNNSAYEYGIYCDSEEEALELYFDYAINHDIGLDRATKIALTLSSEDIAEFTKEGYIEDYISLDGINYLSDVLMRGCFNTCQNCFKGDSE